MSKERRRYFRINETLGITYQIVELAGKEQLSPTEPAADLLDKVFEQDLRIENLLAEVAQTHPKVAELVTVFNQKLERVVSQLVMENRLMDRIARRVKEANISACGIAFTNDEAIPVDSRLKMELSLFPGDVKLDVSGRVVGCDPSSDQVGFYWRIEFYGMKEQAQEQLIQHIVKRQSAQLKSRHME